MPREPIVHRRSDELTAKAGPAAWFTGVVSLENLSMHEGMGLGVLRVSFAPGARTAWHTHPEGQVLIVTSGNGLFGTRQQTRRMSAGDVIEIDAGVEHWHGAAASTPLQHLALQSATDWRDPVSDDEYAFDTND